MTENLKGSIEGTEINVFLVRDTIKFFVIPVNGLGGQGYRLWKWINMNGG